MANRRVFSSSSSSSSSSVTHDSWTHDVFLSFRGEDTRTNFTDHLYKALSDKGIVTFIDLELTRGEEMSPALLKAIEESRFSLIVFSENYGSSRWCLDELVKILQCKERKQQIVLPIFYKVDPSHVRNQTKSYGDAFAEHNCRYKDNMEKVLKWRNALREAANLSGLPLSLKLLGSHLRNKGVHRWQAILSDAYGGDPYTSIQKIHGKSYDALKTSVQQVFLDIACFFKGEDKDYVLQIVSSSKHKVPQDCIEELVEKAMITIQSNMILMHDLLEQLGKDIIHEESPNDPGKRSRLWFHQDVLQVLTENTGTRNIKGIMVKCPKPDEIPLILNAKSLSGMVNLEIFINRNAIRSGCIDHLPNELRLIDWGRCQLQFFPSNFHARHLVVFNMPCSDIRQLEIFKNSPNVTSINLSGCEFLEKIPDLTGIPNIKFLNLSQCTSLVEVHDSVGFLDKLVKLDLRESVKLTRFATRLRLKSLKSLCVHNCQRLESFPEIEDEMECLTILNMEGSGIRELPSSIVNLTRLQELRGD
ncbi:unnamed protein product, partial [Prunus brigantina]